MQAANVIEDLSQLADPNKARSSNRFFKTGAGQYGEGDIFIGVNVPNQKVIAKKYTDLTLTEIKILLRSPIHEHRLTSLFILRLKYLKANSKGKKEIADFYYKNRTYVNNWDLVDSSAPYIYGDYLKSTDSQVLYSLVKSKSLWDRRISIVSTFAWIKDNELNLTLDIATLLLEDDQDLIHKAVGWALREVGKKDEKILTDYLNKYAQIMPRTTLRYSIERLSPELRASYLSR